MPVDFEPIKKIDFQPLEPAPQEQDLGFWDALLKTLQPEAYQSLPVAGYNPLDIALRKGTLATAETVGNVMSLPARLLYSALGKVPKDDKGIKPSFMGPVTTGGVQKEIQTQKTKKITPVEKSFNELLSKKTELGDLVLGPEGNVWGKIALDIVGDPANYISGRGLLKALGGIKSVDEAKNILTAAKKITDSPELYRAMRQVDLEKVFNSPDAIEKIANVEKKIQTDAFINATRAEKKKILDEVFNPKAVIEQETKIGKNKILQKGEEQIKKAEQEAARKAKFAEAEKAVQQQKREIAGREIKQETKQLPAPKKPMESEGILEGQRKLKEADLRNEKLAQSKAQGKVKVTSKTNTQKVEIPELKSSDEGMVFGLKHQGNKQVINDLKKRYEEVSAKYAELRKKDIRAASLFQMNKQAVREALEAATNTGSAKAMLESKSFSQYAKGAVKAIAKDMKNPTSLGSTFGGEYKHLDDFIKTTKLRLSDADKRILRQGVSKIVNSKTVQTSEQRMAQVEKFINDFKPVQAKEISTIKEVPKIAPIERKGASWLGGDPEVLTTKSAIRKHNAIMTREETNAITNAEKQIKFWDKQPEETQITFQRMMETEVKASDLTKQGMKREDAVAMANLARQYRQRLNKAWDMSNEVDKVNYIENYFPHVWENPDKAEKFFKNYVKKFNTNPAFKQKRVIDFIDDGLDYGLKLRYSNPEMVVLAREIAGFKHKLAKNILKDLEGEGLIKKITNGKIDAGWTNIKSPAMMSYQAPERVAKVLDNYLMPGLWTKGTKGAKLFRGASHFKNQVVALKLGLSGFHAIETGVSSMATELTQALKYLGRGKFLKAGESLVRSPFAPFTGQFTGHSLVKAWKTGIAKNDFEKFTIEMIDRAGGRLDISKQWAHGVEGQFKQMARAFRTGKYGTGLAKIVPATMEKISAPIMKHWVPNLKAATFSRLAKDVVENSGLTGKALDQRLAKVWDSMDNRFGQLVYDNIFWNKTAKDLGVFSQISMGWNIGTWREFGGAGIDLAKLIAGKATGKKANIITDRMLYTITYALTFGTMGAIMNKMMTGEDPKSYLDYFYPRTGEKNPDGSDERLQMPTMLKEYAASTEALRKYGPVKGTAMYAWHKTNPIFSMMGDLVANRDFYGTEIYDEGAPIVDNVGNVADYFYRQGIQPISVSSYLKRKEQGDKNLGLSIFGFTPAPSYITKTKSQKEIYDAFEAQEGGRGTKTRSDYENYKKKAEVRRAIMSNDSNARSLFYKYQKEGIFSDRTSFNSYKKMYELPSDVRLFKRLTEERKKRVLEGMDEKDRAYYMQFTTKSSRRRTRRTR